MEVASKKEEQMNQPLVKGASPSVLPSEQDVLIGVNCLILNA
jgi:hypothetical protein